MRPLFAFMCVAGLAFAPPLMAESDMSADAIAARMLRSDAFGWEGAKTRLRMILIDKSGARKERHMEILGHREEGKLKTKVRFLGPKEIAGTAFLMLDKGAGASEQYIYLSGLKRTRRIVGREREGSFMGSDFSYADMQRVDAKHGKKRRLPDEDLGGTSVYVIEAVLNKDAPSKYSRVTTWVRKSDFLAMRTRFYDRGGKLLKTLYTRRVKQLEGQPVVMEARMQNAQTGHATELIVESIERQDQMSSKDFTPASLEH